MISLKEHRLIRRNIDDFVDPTETRTSSNRISRRDAERRAQQQQGARRTTGDNTPFQQNAPFDSDPNSNTFGQFTGPGFVGNNFNPNLFQNPNFDPNIGNQQFYNLQQADGSFGGQVLPNTPNQFGSFSQGATQAGDQAVNRLGRGASTEEKLRARQQAEANYYAQINAEQTRQGLQRQKESATAGSDAPAPETGIDPSLQAALSSLSPEEQNILAPFLTANQSNLQQGLSDSNATAQGLLQQTGNVFGGIQSNIDEMKANRMVMRDSIQDLTEDVRDDNERMISKNEQAAEERLQWNRQKQERDVERQKTAAHESMVVQYALDGGFGQIANTAAVRESDAMFDQRLQDIQTEFGIQATELSAKYTSLYVQNNNQYRADSIKNWENYISSIETLTTQGNANSVAFLNAQTSILEKAATREANLRKTYATENTKLAQEMLDQLNEKRDAEKEAKNDAYEFFNFAFSKSTDPALRRKAVEQMSSAGYPMPEDIDINADPISFQLAAMNNAVKIAQNTATDPFRFTGEDADIKQALSASALTVVGQMDGGVELNRSQLSYVNQLLDQGKIQQARSHLRGLAVAGMSGTQQESFSSRSTIISASKSLLDDLKEIQKSKKGKSVLQGLKDAWKPLEGKQIQDLTSADFDIYNKKLSQVRNALAADSDPALKNIFSQIENIAGIIINERYGAAVTDGEMARAREFIAMSGNTLGDTIIKMENFAKFSKLQNETMMNIKMGLPDTELDLNAPDVNSTPAVPTDDDFNRIFLSGSTGVRTDRHNNPTAFTTTIAKQAGLSEGIDYEVGDPFPNDSRMFTARLLGDPINTTIRVIDNIGFFTGKGQQRWSHTAMSKDKWNSLSLDQKKKVIMEMYQKEGGSQLISLFSNVS